MAPPLERQIIRSIFAYLLSAVKGWSRACIVHVSRAMPWPWPSLATTELAAYTAGETAGSMRATRIHQAAATAATNAIAALTSTWVPPSHEGGRPHLGAAAPSKDALRQRIKKARLHGNDSAASSASAAQR